MWTNMAAWKNLDFDFGVHMNHPTMIFLNQFALIVFDGAAG